MLRSVVLVLAVLLLLPDSAPEAASSEARADPACVAQVRSRLPGPSAPTTVIRGRPLGAKRLIFRRGKVLLVVDHAVLRATTFAFLEENGAERFPQEARMLRMFLKRLERADEVAIDEARLGPAARDRLSYRLAAVLDQGAFEIRRPGGSGTLSATSNVVLRLDWSYQCGDLCAGEGRVFITEDCQELVSVTDSIS